MNRHTTRFRTVAATGALVLSAVLLPVSAQAVGFGGGAPSGQASQNAGGAQTQGLLDWYVCWPHKHKRTRC